MQNIIPFQYKSTTIRTVTEDGQPLFCGRDVATVLGYENPTKAIRDHCKGGPIRYPLETPGGIQQVRFITEPDLYRLIASSKLPSAQQFEKWVFEEVLPSIRKHGVYALDELLQNDDFLEQALTALRNERKQRQAAELEAGIAKQQLAEVAPKASYYDVVLQSKELVSVSKIAKDFGITAQKLNKLLADAKVQYKQGGVWLLYKKYAEQGYTQSKTHLIDADHTRMHTYWTQKGRLFIYDLLKREFAILPSIECDQAV